MIRAGQGALATRARWIAGVALGLVACTGDPPPQDTEGCTPGAIGCACAGEGWCDEGLLCKAAICVPSSGSTSATSDGATSDATTEDSTSTTSPRECTCHDDCDDGLICDHGTCVFDPAVGCGAVIEIPLPRTNVVLVVDKSASMVAESWDGDGDPNTPPVTRWSSLHAAIEQFAATYEISLHLGAVLVPSKAAITAYTIDACPVEAIPEVAVAPENGAAIVAALPPASAGDPEVAGATPTRTGLLAALDHLTRQVDNLPGAIVLITDGAANCSPEAIDEEARFEVVDGAVIGLVAEAAMAGIFTHVVGVDVHPGASAIDPDGEPDGVDLHLHLDELALAGGAAKDDPSERFHNVHGDGDLTAALDAIAGAMIPCVVPLDPAPTWPDEVTVEVGDVDYGHALARACGTDDGWRYTDASATAIELCGQACAGARAEGGADAVYHCSDEPPPEPPGCR